MAVARELIRVELAQGLLHHGVRQRHAMLGMPTGYDEMALAAADEEIALDVTLALFAQLGLQSTDAAALTVGDKERLLFALCGHLYGAAADLVARCPHCDEQSELTIRFAELQATAWEVDNWFELGAGWRVELRAPTLADIAAVSQLANPGTALIKACIARLVDATGNELNVAALPREFEPRLAACLETLDPAAETVMHVTCPACDSGFDAEVDALMLLSKKLSGRDALYGEVFRMARAYHWSEADILNLPVNRRRSYLAVAETAMGAA